MLAFHVDMNVAQFTRPYLEKWLRELSRIGYDTILWEVENNIRWETCPECVSPDAFTREEFGEILDLCRELGLEPVPLFQVFAHCEYVLKHDACKHLAEKEGDIRQYCPRNPELLPFLARWIDEYLEVFGDVKHFHLGSDEAWWMGECDECRAYVEEHSMGRLFVDHVSAVAGPLLARGITPAIWADMVLHHHEALDLLSRDIMLFDWIYSIHRGDGGVQIWGVGKRTADEIPPDALARFSRFLYPHGYEPGRDPETFYTADFLAAEGFEVVGCPSSSSYGDNVFAPRHWYHLVNTFDWFKKGLSKHLCGGLLTSWSVHLHPWELQLSCIDVGPFLAGSPDGMIEEYQEAFARERFGLDATDVFRAFGLLSKTSLFTHTSSLGHDKSTRPVPVERAGNVIARAWEEAGLDQELANSRARLEEYREGLALLGRLRSEAGGGHEYLAVWDLAARNLINRAEAACFLMEHSDELAAGAALSGSDAPRAAQLLDGLRALRAETDRFYASIIKPSRRAEYMAWMFGAVEHALATLAGLPALRLAGE